MLDDIKNPEDLRGYDAGDLGQIADGLRSFAVTAAMPSGAGLDIFGKAFPERTFEVGIAEQHADVELLLVVGAKNSSNSNRLHENSLETGVRSHLVADSGELRSEWFDNVKSVGVIAGAFAPEVLVGGVIWLRRLGPVEISTLNGPDETIEFRLPPELASVSSLPRLPTALARPLSQG